jgi:hypothetical protein
MEPQPFGLVDDKLLEDLAEDFYRAAAGAPTPLAMAQQAELAGLLDDAGVRGDFFIGRRAKVVGDLGDQQRDMVEQLVRREDVVRPYREQLPSAAPASVRRASAARWRRVQTRSLRNLQPSHYSWLTGEMAAYHGPGLHFNRRASREPTTAIRLPARRRSGREWSQLGDTGIAFVTNDQRSGRPVRRCGSHAEQALRVLST